jgi:hypothetical protein
MRSVVFAHWLATATTRARAAAVRHHHPTQSVNSFDLAQFPVVVAAADEAKAVVLDFVDPHRPGRHGAAASQARLDESGRVTGARVGYGSWPFIAARILRRKCACTCRVRVSVTSRDFAIVLSRPARTWG